MLNVQEALAEDKVLLLDGAFGTQLAARGGASPLLAVLETPELVKAIHSDYKTAGADIVLTNTFLANPISLEQHGAADRFEELNKVAVKLCKEAVGDMCLVAGDIGPTGKLMEPYGDYTEQQLLDCFAAQCKILTETGADLLIIETMTDVNEAAAAVKAAKSVTDIPVIASVSFDPGARGFRTVFGQDVAQVVSALEKAGADVIGSNCGTVDPTEMSEVIREMKTATDRPLSAEPNAGKPQLRNNLVTFDLSPEQFAEGALKCIEAGARLIGGCCGTSPAHIAELAKRLR